MYTLKHWPLRLIASSFKARLAIAVFVFLGCLGPYAVLFPVLHNGMVMIIPIVLSAWLFKYRGLLIGVSCTVIVLFILNNLFFAAIFWQHAVISTMLGGLIAGIVVGFMICMVRYSVDIVEESRQQVIQEKHDKLLAYERQQVAQDAEKRITLAYEQQCQLNQEKDLFLARVNHELCTPLVTISGYLELFLAYHEQLDEWKKTSYVSKALESAQEMNQLVANLLDTAQLSSNHPSPCCAPVLLAQVTREVLAGWNPRDLQDFTFLVEIPNALTAWADHYFLRHILRNLLSNACKYASKYTTVRIYATYHSSEGSQEVWLCVQDEGKGIPPSQTSLLFESFVRLPRDLNSNIRGNGLGLYICKQLIEAQGGRIWVESSGRAGEGSCFYLALPTAASSECHDSLCSITRK